MHIRTMHILCKTTNGTTQNYKSHYKYNSRQNYKSYYTKLRKIIEVRSYGTAQFKLDTHVRHTRVFAIGFCV